MANSIILNIPHASSYIPPEDENKVFLPHVGFRSYTDMLRRSSQTQPLLTERNNMIEQELLVMTDWYTDELFDQSIGKAIVAPVSRLVCDTERFSHDEEESMAGKGMGYCYTNGSKGQVIKEVNRNYKDEILWRYYAPHHIALTDAVEQSLLRNNSALILDCHSFLANPLPYEPDQNSNRPDICLGTDLFHTSESLIATVKKFFTARGFTVSINSPYSGSIVPMRYYHQDQRVQSVMIEINRGLYLKTGTKEKSRGFERILKTLFDFELLLKSYTENL